MSLEQIDYPHFATVEMRVGRIREVKDFPRAKKPAYRLKIDFGNNDIRQSSAQITHYTYEELRDRLIVCVTNFPPRNIAGFQSEVLVLGVTDEEGRVILLKPSTDVPLGGIVH